MTSDPISIGIDSIVSSNMHSHISNYRGQGVLKPGLNASSHGIVYLRGTKPMYLPGEEKRGMYKKPIEIVPTDPDEELSPASRVNFGKVYPIELNVKVHDVGMISDNDMRKLLSYYRMENEIGTLQEGGKTESM